MRSMILGLTVAAILVGGCKTTHTYYVDSGIPLGLTCTAGGAECYNGAICAEGECTLPCTATGTCQAGHECFPSTEAQGGFACLKVRYTAEDNLGAACGVDPSVCGPRAFCQGLAAGDVESFCSMDCTDDRDCPPTLYCGEIGVDGDAGVGTDLGCGQMARKACVKKAFCSPCTFDSDCPGGYCVPDVDGARFCTKACIPPTWDWDPNAGTCPLPWGVCRDRGDGVTVCYHRYGSCTGDGTYCAACRNNGDCAANAYCYVNDYTKERFCTQYCTGNSQCGGGDNICLTVSTSPGCENQCLNYGPGFDPNNPPTDTKWPTCYPNTPGTP